MRSSYRRLLLKLSGEALMGKGSYSIDVLVVDRLGGRRRL
jgi:uridylate kinase